ncbi:MAG TPA: MBL fold metallo-hydrolase [Candidatus Saccharimonadales bacterium]|nr:MBL fold metallo-hydrolase [Candidatus Saccharimonadales bacterium]
MGVADGWVELGDRFFVRRYAFYDQNIGLVLGRDEALVIDTRSTPGQAREVIADVREITRDPVTVVVDTHGHFDHAYGNACFRPATIWGHERCVTFMERTGEMRKSAIARDEPSIAAELEEVVIDPPDRTFSQTASVEVGGREIRLSYLGRGHTDHDIVVTAPGTDVVWAGDLVENGAVPFFGDGYPLDWVATAAALAVLVDPARGVVVPGHGDHAGRAMVDAQAASFGHLADLARRVHAGELDVEAAIAAHPFPERPPEEAREAVERALKQVGGGLD